MQRFCPCGRHLPGEELHWSYHLTKRGMVFEGKLRMHHIGPGLQRTSQLHHPQTRLLTTSPVRLLTLTKPYVQREVHGEPATTLLSKSSQNSDLLGGREVTHLSLKQDEFNIFHQRCKQLHVRNEVRRKHIGRGAEHQAAVGGPATHDTTTPSAPTAANSIVARASSWEAPNTSPPTPSRCRSATRRRAAAVPAAAPKPRATGSHPSTTTRPISGKAQTTPTARCLELNPRMNISPRPEWEGRPQRASIR